MAFVPSFPTFRLGRSSSSSSNDDDDDSSHCSFYHSFENVVDDHDYFPIVEANNSGETFVDVMVKVDPDDYIVIEEYLVVPNPSYESNTLL